MSSNRIFRPCPGLPLAWFLAVVAIAAMPSAAHAGPAVTAGGGDLRTLAAPPVVEIAASCTRLFRLQGRDVLVNTCGDCRNVQIVRSRSGGALPEVRTFRVERKSRLPLPYKTAGSTRITSDESCAPEGLAEQKSDRAVAEANAQCILIGKVARGYVLLNRCPACRSTVVRWSYADGSEKNFPVVIDARKSVAVPKAGETGLSVAHEEPCEG